MFEMLIIIFRFILLLLSFLGYVFIAHDRLRIQSKLTWIFVFSSIGCSVYFAGLINVLLPVAYLLYIIGLGLTLYYLFSKRYHDFINIRSLNLINASFAVGFLSIFLSLIRTQFIHYDNFSHWGIIVKYLLSTNRFPTYASDLIDFKTYPLGSSSFIYYVTTFVGQTEGVMLVAQALLILACFYALFAVIRDTKRFLLTSVLGLSIAIMTIFSISVRINNLLVDFLLPLLALAALAGIFTYRKNLKRACFVSFPILSFLPIVKNSGLFFSVLCYVYLLFIAFNLVKNKIMSRIQAFGYTILTIPLSLVPFLMWNVHTSTALEGTLSKHTMSVENFVEVSNEKTPEMIETIVRSFFNSIFSLESLAAQGVILIHVVAIGAYIGARLMSGKKWNTLKMLLVLDCFLVIYYLSNLAMFVFTMPTEEALILAGLERYLSSMIIFSIGCMTLTIVNNTENSFYVQQGEERDYLAFKSLKTKQIYQNVTLLFTAITSSLLFSEINGMNSIMVSYDESLPGQVSELLGDRWEELSDDRYFIYATDENAQVSSFYLEYVARYFLMAPDVEGRATIDEETTDDLFNEYDYLVVLEEDETINQFIHLYTDTISEDTMGIYEIEEQLLQKISSN